MKKKQIRWKLIGPGLWRATDGARWVRELLHMPVGAVGWILEGDVVVASLYLDTPQAVGRRRRRGTSLRLEGDRTGAPIGGPRRQVRGVVTGRGLGG